MRRPAILHQILAVNALLIVATVFAASVAAQLDLTDFEGQRQFGVLAAAILLCVLGNGFVLRRRFEPLDRLIETMSRVDLARPGLRAAAHPADEAQEVARLRDAFNRMLTRLEEERAGAHRAVLRAQEAERARVARDLHDEVNQALTAVLLRLEASAQDAPPALHTELEETKRLATTAMEELLRLARELRPAALDDLGLIAALRTQVAQAGRHDGVDARFAVEGEPPALGDDEQLVAYRVVQESLSNAIRHAGARRVEVRLTGRRLRITDDGRGFDTAAAHDGLGLAGMRERALLVGADLQVRSMPGLGTTVELAL